MGLRVEQQNIEDLLKYFIARNEFKRRNIVEILKDLTDEERAKLNISNYAEFYNYYKFLYKVLRQDIIEGAKTTIKDSKDLIGRCYYTKEFLMRYPFEYILELRLTKAISKEYTFIYDSLEDKSWQVKETGETVNLSDYGISLNGDPDNGDTIKVSYSAFDGVNHETATITIEQGKNLIKPIIDTSIFGKKVRDNSPLNYTDKDTVDELFEKIIESNPEITSKYEEIMLISPEFTIYNNSEKKCNLADVLTFTEEVYFMSDDDISGLTEKTKNVIILAALRKILDDRNVNYNESDYLVNVEYDSDNTIVSYDLVIDTLLNLVLDTNPLTKEDLPEGKEETFRTLQNEINNLKAYVNDYVVNETRHSENKYFMKNGKANYSGYSLCTTIPHNTGLQPANIIINNVNQDATMDIGNVYVNSDTKNIYVYNTGKNRSEFEFTIIFDTGEYLEFPKDRTFKEFVEIAANGINKVKLDKSLVSRNEKDQITIQLIDVNNEPLFHKFDFLIITNKETKKNFYYRVDDTELFTYDEASNTLTIISDEIEASLEDTYIITAMQIDDAPIMYLLTQLMMNPNYYIQHIIDFSTLMYIPTDEEYKVYEEVLGTEAVESLKKNKRARFIDLTSYNVTEDDILFINGLAYSLLDHDHFKLFYTVKDEEIDRRILIITNLAIDDRDDIYLSRLNILINPFELVEGNDSSYLFDKYVYLTANSSFGQSNFKSDDIPSDNVTEESFLFDSSSRMFNEHPLTNRIEGFNNHYAHHNCEYDEEQIDYDDNYMYIDCYKGQHGFTTKVPRQNKYTVVSHKLGKVPNFVNINPVTSDIDSEEGFVGNIWWTVDDENIYVYNDGDSSCRFEWFANYDENCKVEDHKYGDIVSFDKKNCLFYNVTPCTTNLLEYYGNNHITYNKDTKQIVVENTNINNSLNSYTLTYITGKHVTNKKFLEYSEDFTSNQEGYFDKNPDAQPTGNEVLNYSGEFRAATTTVYGNGIVQYLPADTFDTFEVGDIVSYVDGVCKVSDKDNYRTMIGVIASKEDAGLVIDRYNTSSKVAIALNGIQFVKVFGNISAGEKIGLVTDNADLKGVATNKDYESDCYIGKALENYNEDGIGCIRVLIGGGSGGGSSTDDIINSLTPVNIIAFKSSKTILEKGTSISEVKLSWELSREPSEIYITNNTTGTEYMIDSKATKSELVLNETIDNNTKFTLYVSNGTMESTSSVNINFYPAIYYGVVSSEDITSEDISSLTKKVQSSKKTTFIVTAEKNDYIYFVTPNLNNYTDPTFRHGIFEGGFIKLNTTIELNDLTYSVYRSSQKNLGLTEITVE